MGTITAPGVYPNIPDTDYHRDPVVGGSLSSSELRLIAKSPAKYRWKKDNPLIEHIPAFSFGHAAHLLVLGAGPQLVIVDAADWRTKAAKEARAEALAAGHIPLLPDAYHTVQQMAAAIRNHPTAAALLDPERGGQPEQTIVWQHPAGINGRARADWYPNITATGRPILTDYKTTAQSADTATFARTAANYGYHQQAAWYLSGVSAVTGIADPALVFVVQEKEPPFLVNVVELDDTALSIGRDLNNLAVDTYLRCVETGEWPGYGPDVALASLPRWTEIAHEQLMEETHANDHF